MIHFAPDLHAFVGSAGSLPIADHDIAALRFAMLLEGECQLGPSDAAEKFGLSRQRYFQLRDQYNEGGGVSALNPRKPGPKHNSCRTEAVVRHVIRHRFLDPEASTAVIAQKLAQCGIDISQRSVERVFHDYGLQKKTLSPT